MTQPSQVDALGRFKELDNSPVAFDFEHLAAADFAVGKLDLAQFVIGDAFDVLYDHQGARDFLNGFILFYHASSPPAITSSISACICFSMSS